MCLSVSHKSLYSPRKWMNYVVGRLLCLNNLSRDWNVWHFFKGRYKLVFINDFTNVKIRQWMKCVFISFRVLLVLEFLRLSYLFLENCPATIQSWSLHLRLWYWLRNLYHIGPLFKGIIGSIFPLLSTVKLPPITQMWPVCIR